MAHHFGYMHGGIMTVLEPRKRDSTRFLGRCRARQGKGFFYGKCRLLRRPATVAAKLAGRVLRIGL